MRSARIRLSAESGSGKLNRKEARMVFHDTISDVNLRRLIHSGAITFAGNQKLKIYGRLCCGSGKRIKRTNRVFFKNEKEATLLGYRPCKKCMSLRKISKKQVE